MTEDPGSLRQQLHLAYEHLHMDRPLEAILTRGSRQRRNNRRNRIAGTCLTAVLLPAGGVSVAAANGLIPPGASIAFLDWRIGPHQVDLTTATRVYAEPGPAGRTFEVWVAASPPHGECVSMNFTSTAAADPSTASQLPSHRGGACSPVTYAAAGGFGQGPGVTTWGSEDYTQFAYPATNVTRVELHLTDGQVLPVPIQNGWVAGWLPKGTDGAGADLVGYAPDGAVVGKTILYPR